MNEQTGEPIASLNLRFNLSVDPQVILQNLNIKADGKTIEQKNLLNATDQDLKIGLPEIAQNEKIIELKLSLDGKTAPIGSSTGIGDDLESKVFLPSIYNLNIEQVLSDHDGVHGTITVFTSQSVNSTDLKEHVKIEPSINFNTRTTNGGFIITSDKFDIDKKYEVRVEKSLKGRLGGKMKRSYEKRYSIR